MAVHAVRGIVLIASVAAAVQCSRPLIRNAPRPPVGAPAAPLSQLWIEPLDLGRKNLFWGPGSRANAPAKNMDYKVLRRDETGYSKGYDVEGPDGRRWDVKIGREAQTEVAVSRILWALGYHQPETYYMTGWRLAGTWASEGEPARFRLQSDHETDGDWKWVGNPFDGSRPMHGLIAINLLLSNWDIKTSNNRVYRMPVARGGPARQYVVQDLGASLGKPRVFPIPIGTRNDIDDFETTKLISRVHGDEVSLDYRGRHGEILDRLNVADVIWACQLMNRLSNAQLDDAFEAAQYDPRHRQRFVTKIRAKIQEGLALRTARRASSKEQG